MLLRLLTGSRHGIRPRTVARLASVMYPRAARAVRRAAGPAARPHARRWRRSLLAAERSGAALEPRKESVGRSEPGRSVLPIDGPDRDCMCLSNCRMARSVVGPTRGYAISSTSKTSKADVSPVSPWESGIGVQVMAKSGMDYQEIVAKVEQALNPGAVITVNPWVKGPDGKRDCDVLVRGSADGKPIFVFIECKDWRRRPVGVEVIDALDSKRSDVGATHAVIYSNSGFTSIALRKAQRKGITTCSAVAEGDDRIRVSMTTYVTVKKTRVSGMNFKLYYEGESSFDDGFELQSLRVQDGPILNWARTEIVRVCRLVNNDRPLTDYVEVKAQYLWDEPLAVSMGEISTSIRALEIIANIDSIWLGQQAASGGTLGRFDHESGNFWIPSGEGMLLGPLDVHNRDDWEVLDGPPEEGEAGPLRFYRYRTVEAVGDEVPDLSPAIAKCEALLTRRSGDADILSYSPNETRLGPS
jgi:hypothetical protein